VQISSYQKIYSKGPGCNIQDTLRVSTVNNVNQGILKLLVFKKGTGRSAVCKMYHYIQIKNTPFGLEWSMARKDFNMKITVLHGVTLVCAVIPR